MSYKQFKYYQDLGDYAAAYQMARTEWEANPGLQWPRNAIAWLLIRMMKLNTRAYSREKFLKLLDEFRRLHVPEKDRDLWGAVAWPIRDIVADSYQMQWFTPEFGDGLFAALREMPFSRPSDSYTALVKVFLPLGGLWPRLAEFIEWWGFDSFTPFDYRRYPEDGRLVSLAEKVFAAYLAALRMEGIEREPSIAFFEGVNQLALHSKEQAEAVYMILNFDKQR